MLAGEKTQINRTEQSPGIHGLLVLDTDTKIEKAVQWRKGRLPNKRYCDNWPFLCRQTSLEPHCLCLEMCQNPVRRIYVQPVVLPGGGEPLGGGAGIALEGALGTCSPLVPGKSDHNDVARWCG